MRTTRGSAVLSVMAFVAIGLAACNGNDGEGTPIPTETAATTPMTTATAPTTTATPTLEELEAEVAEAYLAYWDAYAEAVLELDVSLVEGHAVDDELEQIRGDIEALRTNGEALRVDVEHDFAVVHLTETEVTIIDEIVNRSFSVDPATKLPEEAEIEGNTFRDTVQLEYRDGRWVVVSGSRERRE